MSDGADQALGNTVASPCSDKSGEPMEFWERGRKYPHKYNIYKDGYCAYGCGCRIGPGRPSSPEGISAYGLCPNHPERPNPYELFSAALRGDEDAAKNLARDNLLFGWNTNRLEMKTQPPRLKVKP